ncbi:hypothetical protein Tco_1206050 [Tanacetum coccineum]
MDYSDQKELSDEYYTKKFRKVNKEDIRDDDKLRRHVINFFLHGRSNMDCLRQRRASNVSSIPEMDDFELTSFWIDQGLPSKERNHLMRGGRSGLDTLASSTRNSFEPRPMIAESWDYLRKSLVRGQPVGRIAAL